MTFFIGTICFIGGVAIGFYAMAALTTRWLKSSSFKDQVKEDITGSFNAGFLCAADCVTLAGHGELAGKLRRVVQESKAANDN